MRSPPAKRSRKSNSTRRTRSFASQSSETGRQPSSYSSYRRSTLRQERSSLPYSFDVFTDPSPDNVQQRLTKSASHSFITGGLIRIYHDSMENALSCWLTERTCPYSADTLSLVSRINSEPQESMADEWGPNWSNRICDRVCRLDRASSAVRDRPLTLSEDRAASRALQTAIMAFATQWAHSSQRSETEFSSFMATEIGANSLPEFTDNEFGYGEASTFDPGDATPSLPIEFDRSIQETFWNQASQALHETSNVESFRVIFAHIIFSLTLRPLDVDKHVRTMKNGGAASNLDELDQVIESEGPPLFLETALRQIFSYRIKLERIERQRAMKMREAEINNLADDAASVPIRADPLSVGDRKTFNLLFWLAIMFDTLSAAMNKRPLVVSDEDSDILRGNPWDSPQAGKNDLQDNFVTAAPTSYHSMFTKEDDLNLWGKFFLKQKDPRQSQYVARWPCSYNDAAATLSDAAPIKVLFFRKVTHLQTLLSRRARHEKLEEAIHDALKIYQHWNDNYAPFMRDCIARHDDLPPRIQSWYVILAGHWHLAGLLLADMIEAIDEAKMSLESQRNYRQSSLLVSKLRKQNAYAVSDLGRCSCPRYDSSFPRPREFHFAVNKGALLTEPWTVVLIRSFGKAGYILLDSIPVARQSENGRMTADDDTEVEQARTRCEFCIQSLWHLGKKSDMAFLVATALLATFKDRTSICSQTSSTNFSAADTLGMGTEPMRQHTLPDLRYR